MTEDNANIYNTYLAPELKRANMENAPEKILIVGAGLSGAVIARKLAENGDHIDVFESRNHIAGNCHTERDKKTDILVHKYGPHIFHTDDLEVWQYVNQFTEFMPFKNQVKTTIKGEVYSLPINLHTINQFYKKCLNPKEAIEFIGNIRDSSITNPITFEDQALAFVGKDIYEAFFKGYTEKQWGCHPSDLPASILKRLPLRFNYDDNYFSHKFQGMPVSGYTEMVKNILDHPRIEVTLNKEFSREMGKDYKHIFYSGPIDSWFNFSNGRLGYRTLKFESSIHTGDFQGTAVMNYGDPEVPYTRITEHKHFSPWETHENSIIFREYSASCTPGDIPYYPIRLVNEKKMLNQYINLARLEAKVSFVGRLGTYRYIDMDRTIREALDAAEMYKKLKNQNAPIPAFFIDPLA